MFSNRVELPGFFICLKQFGECELGKYRSRLQIIADMLFATENGAQKTQIMYKANLNHRVLKRYLTQVMNAGLVSFDNAGCYRLTRKGEKFVDIYNEYFRRYKRLEKKLNDIRNKKMILERMIRTDLDSPPDASGE